jgi:hypothetical protein
VTLGKLVATPKSRNRPQPILLSPPSPVADKIYVQHPPDDLLERYSMGRLTEAEMAPLERHLLICRECRNRGVLMDVAAIRQTLKRWLGKKIQ